MQPSDYQPLPKIAHDSLDNRLSPERAAEFEAMLKSDPSLRQRYEEVTAALGLLRDMPASEPPAGFDDRLMARIKRQELATAAREKIAPAPMPIWQHIAHVAAGAAAAAVVLVALGLVPLGGGDETEGPVTTAADEIEITDSDLLPVIDDQYRRFSQFTRQLNGSWGDTPEARREYVAAQLEASELLPRSRRLDRFFVVIPADASNERAAELTAMVKALTVVEAELEASRVEGRALNAELISASLGGLKLAETDRKSASLRASGGMPVTSRAETNPESAAYFRAVRASYAGAHEEALSRFDRYLISFPRGRHVLSAQALYVSSLIALERTDEALDRYKNVFELDHNGLAIGESAVALKQIPEAEAALLQRLWLARNAGR